MRLRFDPSLIDYELADLLAMPPEEVVALAWRQREALRALGNRLGEDSTTSSRPPSSDDPYRREERGKPASDAGAAPAVAPPGKAGEPDEKKPVEKKPVPPAQCRRAFRLSKSEGRPATRATPCSQGMCATANCSSTTRPGRCFERPS